MNVGDVLSTRSRAYKDLDLASREVSDEEMLGLMVEHPTLIRRPLIVGKGGAVVGFNRSRLAELASED